MTASKNKEFCHYCEKDVEYQYKKIRIRDPNFNTADTYLVTTACCKECGEELFVPGLIEKNREELDEQYFAQGGTLPRKIPCILCMSEQEYILSERIGLAERYNETFAYCLITPWCKKCHAPVMVPGLIHSISLAYNSQFAQRDKFDNLEDAVKYFCSKYRMAKKTK